LLRIVLIGYLYGISSERKLIEELRMHLAWRWFTGLGFDEEIPHHSTFSKNRHGRFPEPSPHNPNYVLPLIGGFSGLALAVFLLGLNYKVSKYDLQEDSSHRSVPVKLLSQNEQPNRQVSQLLNRPLKTVGAVLIVVASLVWLLHDRALLLRAVPVRTRRTVSNIRRFRPSTDLTIFFFRPPPPPPILS